MDVKALFSPSRMSFDLQAKTKKQLSKSSSSFFIMMEKYQIKKSLKKRL